MQTCLSGELVAQTHPTTPIPTPTPTLTPELGYNATLTINVDVHTSPHAPTQTHTTLSHTNFRYNATLTINADVPVGRAGGLGTKRGYQEQLGKSQAKVNPKILASLHELSQVRACMRVL